MSCRAFFESLAAEEKVSARAGLIDAAHPKAECEGESVSAYSNGVVTDEEFVHRYVFSPLHLHDGKILPALFSDAKDKGLSCERGDSSTPCNELHARGVAQVERFNANRKASQPARTYVGAVTAKVSTVRELKIAEERAYGIYDTALRENTAHVDIFELASAMKGLSNSEQKLARLRLAEAFTDEPVTA